MVIQLIQTHSGQRLLQLPAALLRQAETVVKILWRLRNQPAYQKFCDQDAPDTARYPVPHSGVCMGYDFHILGHQVFLIEVNTNATGLSVLGQNVALVQKILHMFQSEYMLCFPQKPLRTLAIVDENPPAQFFYVEFEFYQKLFENAGFQCLMVDPMAFEATSSGQLRVGESLIDLVYLRWTDFYLDSPKALHLKKAYLQNKVCITPSPREFHLLANKKRLSVFCNPQQLRAWGLSESEIALLTAAVPETLLIQDKTLDQWQEARKDFVFKFTDKFGARGVYLGSTLTRRKLEQVCTEERVAQRYIPASEVIDPQTQTTLKFDLRVIVYQDQVLANLARVYEGQITNFQSPLAAVVPVVGV